MQNWAVFMEKYRKIWLFPIFLVPLWRIWLFKVYLVIAKKAYCSHSY